jgi:hypothetical protein
VLDDISNLVTVCAYGGLAKCSNNVAASVLLEEFMGENKISLHYTSVDFA